MSDHDHDNTNSSDLPFGLSPTAGLILFTIALAIAASLVYQAREDIRATFGDDHQALQSQPGK